MTLYEVKYALGKMDWPPQSMKLIITKSYGPVHHETCILLYNILVNFSSSNTANFRNMTPRSNLFKARFTQFPAECRVVSVMPS